MSQAGKCRNKIFIVGAVVLDGEGVTVNDALSRVVVGESLKNLSKNILK